MNISHSRARQIIHSASYQILEDTEQTSLSGHLQDCRQCAKYADQLPQLERLLTNSLQLRWLRTIPAGEIDLRILPDIEGQVKRKQNLNQLTNSLRVLAWAVGILALVMITSWVISRARSQDVASVAPPIIAATPTPDEQSLPVVGINPSSTQSSTDSGESEQHQKLDPGLTPTTTPNSFVGLKRVLSRIDLNCDGVEERITGISDIINQNYDPGRWKILTLETFSDQGLDQVWEYTAEGAGVGYLTYEQFAVDDCNQFIVLIGYRGKEGIKIFRWDGREMKEVLNRPGTFYPADTLSIDDFGFEVVPPKTFITYEFTSTSTDSKVVWTLLGYEWDGDHLIQTIEKSKSFPGGG
jgi:hypothetical protein